MNEPDIVAPSLPEQFAWLADAPLFIDDTLVNRYHDAVVRPLFRRGKVETEATQTTSLQFSGKLGFEAGVEAGTLVQAMTLGLLKPTAKAKAEGDATHDDTSKEGQKVELLPIDTPQRQLEQLALFYIANLPARLKIVPDTRDAAWRDPGYILSSPRALALIDLPGHAEAAAAGKPQTKLIPTAAEFENGKIELIYQRLSNKQADDQTGVKIESDALPIYPERAGSPAELKAQRAKYWAWFEKNYSATQCMLAVEHAASENGRIRWIDFRLPLTTEGDTLHLHICAGGKYDTGSLAYNLIKRGFKHGLRLVGTLKSEPDMNVLAIYEK